MHTDLYKLHPPEARGKEQGIKEGEQTGIKKIAINMIKKGLDQQLITQMTDLELEEISKLKKI